MIRETFDVLGRAIEALPNPSRYLSGEDIVWAANQLTPRDDRFIASQLRLGLIAELTSFIDQKPWTATQIANLVYGQAEAVVLAATRLAIHSDFAREVESQLQNEAPKG